MFCSGIPPRAVVLPRALEAESASRRQFLLRLPLANLREGHIAWKTHSAADPTRKGPRSADAGAPLSTRSQTPARPRLPTGRWRAGSEIAEGVLRSREARGRRSCGLPDG